ncbi:MAG: NAD-dependent DNA ligase LigA [Parcubacteria group bacterium]|nr:NAD-dependent DNA ligase LigA [Parcubacteria group bacterium]MCR4342747.1 NAD-dependent DNA ligase LigA [Patescibacteria group bacterium]
MFEKKIDAEERYSKAKERIEKLKKLINHHRYLYHVLDKQEITEAALDSLKHELYELEQSFPDLITTDSPTQRVGGKPLEKFKKIHHKVTQWSFNDVFNEDEIREFDNRVKRLLDKEFGYPIAKGLEYVSELKIDGFKIILTYERGILKTAATRGDGKVGEDVTANVKTIESIPLHLNKDVDCIVEGEIWMGKDEFENLNKERGRKGEQLFANPRNAAAGSIRQLDPKIASSRKLDSFIYDLAWLDYGHATSVGIEVPETQIEELSFLKELGFKVNPHFKLCKNIEEVVDFWRVWQKKKDKTKYWIDGVVVKLNNSEWQERLGYTGKAPRFAVALKFPAEQATTVVEDIDVQVGRTGALTPVAHLRPVTIAGSVVSRATLHNEDEIKRLDVRIGDTVILQKAGDIIPDIVSVIKEMRTGKEKLFKMPNVCPICKSKVVFLKDSPIAKCHNKKCATRHRRGLYYFASKKAFDIEGLGPKIIDALLDNNLVQDAADFFDLKEGDITPLERFAEKSAKNLIKAINSRREIDFSRFIISLGIENVGESTAEDLAESFHTIENLEKASIQELEKVSDVGPIVARSIYDWFRDNDNKRFLKKLLPRVMIKKQTQVKGAKLKKLKFVLTGSLSKMSRDEAKKMIKQLGGEVSESVSKNTDFVVYGSDPGSKYDKAKKIGVKTINEEEFLEILG